MEKKVKELPRLETKRLLIRPICLNDANDMFDYAKIDNVGPNAGWTPHKDINETKQIIEYMMSDFLTDNNIGVFSIVYKDDKRMIGTVGIQSYKKRLNCASLGFVLNPDYWGRGITYEASIEVIKWCFDQFNLYRLECSHYDYNNQSRRVIEKLGFTFEGISRKRILLQNGQRCDLYNYGMLKEEYLDKKLSWQRDEKDEK